MTPANMLSVGSRSDSDIDIDKELPLRIALERSKVGMRAVQDRLPRLFPADSARAPALAPPGSRAAPRGLLSLCRRPVVHLSREPLLCKGGDEC